MKRIMNMAALLLLITAASCKKSYIRGNGDTIIESRVVGGFTSVKTNGDIRLFVSYGTTQKVEVKGYANLVDITETRVENNKLVVKYKDEYYNVRNSNVEVYMTIPVLTGAETNGSGNIEIGGFLNGTGIGLFTNGSGNVYVSNSRYDNTYLDVNGSGDIKAPGLLAKNTEAVIHGSGDIEISCTQNLKARLYGSGDVRYWGNPLLDVATSGSGKVKKQ